MVGCFKFGIWLLFKNNTKQSLIIKKNKNCFWFNYVCLDVICQVFDKNTFILLNLALMVDILYFQIKQAHKLLKEKVASFTTLKKRAIKLAKSWKIGSFRMQEGPWHRCAIRHGCCQFKVLSTSHQLNTICFILPEA